MNLRCKLSAFHISAVKRHPYATSTFVIAKLANIPAFLCIWAAKPNRHLGKSNSTFFCGGHQIHRQPSEIGIWPRSKSTNELGYEIAKGNDVPCQMKMCLIFQIHMKSRSAIFDPTGEVATRSLSHASKHEISKERLPH
ncbi:hypothetical protein Nepgr_012425 [Nepenthes gracilis]|uniref:Uncharacterized protein n=1 Tax=Nepenthes gracilis TaxID=150966 RepID=A0AAD3SH69_NEPGR|nr:hypothetical protein Nepgr_012425 [Nepenthes gracilis]